MKRKAKATFKTKEKSVDKEIMDEEVNEEISNIKDRLDKNYIYTEVDGTVVQDDEQRDLDMDWMVRHIIHLEGVKEEAMNLVRLLDECDDIYDEKPKHCYWCERLKHRTLKLVSLIKNSQIYGRDHKEHLRIETAMNKIISLVKEIDKEKEE